MRTVRVARHTLDYDLDPEAAADLGDEPIEIEEPVETLVAWAQVLKISYSDNCYPSALMGLSAYAATPITILAVHGTR